MSRRAAAGSRHNKKHKWVGVQAKDTDSWRVRNEFTWPPFDWRMKPNHQARAVNIDHVFPALGQHAHA
jgi:hypothetical protein